MDLHTKDPDAKLDYVMDWATRLPAGEVINTSTWDVETGLTKATSPASSIDELTTTVWLEGGTVGATYLVTNHIVTAAGRVEEWSFKVQILQR